MSQASSQASTAPAASPATRPLDRLDAAFARARGQGRAALVGYLPAGFPSIPGSVAGLQAMVAGGCDVVEVGLPYSDPSWTVRPSRPPPTRLCGPAPTPRTCYAPSRRWLVPVGPRWS